MPAFYIVVNFIKSQPSDQWVGGRMAQTRGKPFIRIVVTHIHIRLPEDPSIYERLMNRLNELIQPHIEEKGYDWEISIDETDRRLWRINGLAPPEFKSEAEKVWIAENRPVKPEDMALKKQEGAEKPKSW